MLVYALSSLMSKEVRTGVDVTLRLLSPSTVTFLLLNVLFIGVSVVADPTSTELSFSLLSPIRELVPPPSFVSFAGLAASLTAFGFPEGGF